MDRLTLFPFRLGAAGLMATPTRRFAPAEVAAAGLLLAGEPLAVDLANTIKVAANQPKSCSSTTTSTPASGRCKRGGCRRARPRRTALKRSACARPCGRS